MKITNDVTYRHITVARNDGQDLTDEQAQEVAEKQLLDTPGVAGDDLYDYKRSSYDCVTVIYLVDARMVA